MLGGITVILYGMIGLLGAQIWLNAGVDLRNPLNLVPAAAGIIIGVGGVSLKITDNFELSGIALGTSSPSAYHLAHALAPTELRDAAGGTVLVVDEPGIWTDEDVDPPAR